MDKLKVRKPIANFFILRSLQLRLIAKIVMSVLLATVVFATTLLVMYQISYRSAAFYQVTLNKDEPEIGDRLEIRSIILPSLLISSIVNILIAFGVGLYASRKYAVPIYKLEQWAALLHDGNLTAKLRFREKEEMRELSEKCNETAENMRRKIKIIKTESEALALKMPDCDELKKIRDTLKGFETDAEVIEVQTSYMHRSEIPGA